MKSNNKNNSALNLMKGINQPSQFNEDLLSKLKNKKIKTEISSSQLFNDLRKGDRVQLSRAITIIESKNEKHQELARELVDKSLPFSGNSIRIGITGVPGAGKSTFIEALGMHLIEKGHKIAVLAVDPSSERSKGSILGDKTRMENLSSQENAFIRPSPSSGILGGVAKTTRETIILCEAGGYDVIFIETVGVGQSEIVVKSMVDFFLLLMLAGAGDELQGIKRGIMEMADAILINKADNDNLEKAKSVIPTYSSALHFFPSPESEWLPKVMECSSITGHNIPEAWNMIKEYQAFTKANDYFIKNRQQQEIKSFYQNIDDYLRSSFYSNPLIKKSLVELEKLIKAKKISPYDAAKKLIIKKK